MKAVIVAAGMGRRLAPYTDTLPKCMVPVGGKPILVRQIEALNQHGISDIVVIRGYRGDRIPGAGLRFYENPRYQHNNILTSLLCAAPELDSAFVFSYSDIVYHPDALGSLLATSGEAALVVDQAWEVAYEGRTEHPPSEAELSRVEDGRVVRVGKRVVRPEETQGEFIGLARFEAPVAKLIRSEYERLAQELGGRPFGTAANLEVSYMSDMLNHLIDQKGVAMTPAYIEGRWYEIDTTQDLARAERTIDW